MRPALALVLALAACGPSATQLRSNRINAAAQEAQMRPGPRQAQELAAAVHEAVLAGDYRTQPHHLQAAGGTAIAAIDTALPTAGVDAAILIAWRGLMLADLGKPTEALSELERSFQIAPNKLAGRNLVLVYGAANLPQKVGATCAATVDVMRSSDEKLDLIALCRKNMNAASNEGEMAWMSPELVAWYQAENAARLGAEIDAMNARRERERYEQQVVRETEQCSLSCKESGLRCQNRCDGDRRCEDRCVEINHACVDRCGSQAYQQLEQ
ncbi:MAG: hypothetical protein SFX73_03320 [Kofleriaceae bacterium]|nr:hypothetical protein [Kofleriaceae bacterium]